MIINVEHFDTIENSSSMFYYLQPGKEYRAGVDAVTSKFISGHLKNNLLLEKSFLYIEKKRNISIFGGFHETNISSIETEWETVLTDTDLGTSIKWCRTNHILGESIVEIQWSISKDTDPGIYRITHVGYYKVYFSALLFYNTFLLCFS